MNLKKENVYDIFTRLRNSFFDFIHLKRKKNMHGAVLETMDQSID